MDFPIVDLMDEQACYAQLVAWLHPHGLACPRCHHADRMVVHRRGRDPVLDFRCGHVAGEWARDDDGDGIREVHVNTSEGLWTGLRNFLRPFRGVNKMYLYQYVAIFEWG